jgi:hypothetical protein
VVKYIKFKDYDKNFYKNKKEILRIPSAGSSEKGKPHGNSYRAEVSCFAVQKAFFGKVEKGSERPC